MPDIIITVKEYLARLEAEQSSRDNPVPVPNLKELAESIGISEKHFLRIVNNKVKGPNLKTIAPIITELRHRGFLCDVGDLLRYVE